MRDAGITRIDPEVAGPFRLRRLDADYLITNEFGDWLFLTPDELREFAHGSLPRDGDLFAQLRDARFVHGELDLSDAAGRYRRRHAFLLHGPRRHALVVNGPEAAGDAAPSMDPTTATRAVDCAFMSTASTLDFVVTGHDPVASWDVVTQVVQYARDKNRLAGKTLSFELEADARTLSAEQTAWLAEHSVRLRALVGDDALADLAAVEAALKTLHDADADGPRAILAVDFGRAALAHVDALCALAVSAGCDGMELRRAPSFRFVLDGEGEPDCTVEAWLEGYERALDQLLAAERDGHPIVEDLAATFLAKILGDADPDDHRVRSPGADGIGQLAYQWDGRVYASELGRELDALVDEPLFGLGELRFHGYHDMMTSPTVRALVVATTLDGQPHCRTCGYKPFCGMSAAANYAEQGSIQGRPGDSQTCQRFAGIQDLLFRRLREGDAATQAAFARWAESGSPSAL